MSEKEIIQRQQQSGNKEFYLVLVGKFLHAIDHGAFALSRATGYKVVRKQRKNGPVLVCGFPIDRLDIVRQRLRDAGAWVEQINDKLYRFNGLDGSPDDRMISHNEAKSHNGALELRSLATKGTQDCPRCEDSWVHDSWLEKALLSFNLSMSTPMDAMNLIAKLQQQLRKEDIAEKVQGADCPQGKAPGIACESPSGHGSTE